MERSKVTINPDENVLEWVSKIIRSIRMKEIEYADRRDYELAIEMKEKADKVYDDVLRLYPHLLPWYKRK